MDEKSNYTITRTEKVEVDQRSQNSGSATTVHSTYKENNTFGEPNTNVVDVEGIF